MRTSSRSLASSCRSTPVLGRGRLSAAAIALGLLASTSAAYAQPAAPQPAQPPAGQPPAGQPPAGQPAAGQPAAGQAAPGAAAPAGSPDARPQDEPLVPPPAATPPAAGGTTAPAAGTTTVASPDPDRDQRALSRQGAERPAPTGDVGQRPSEVFSEDWWSQARPSFELHGLFRVRAELFHHFALGRRDPVGSALWPQPPDNSYVPTSGTRQLVRLCGDNPLNTSNCENNTQAGANMRFRLTPELHISDNLRVMSQIDIFDNVVLGSTPEGYANQPGANGYAVVAPGGYAPLGAFAQTAWAPVGGQTSLTDSIVVKRVWGEYATPVGLLRFGRMPNQWGLGILNNEGNGYDSDWQSTVDRIMFVTGIPKYDLYFTGAWDFIHEGPLSASQQQQQGQPYDLGQLDDVSQYVLMAARRRDPELARLDLAKGLPVINGGVYFAYRNQVIANDSIDATNGAAFGRTSEDVRLGYTRRGAQFFTPDVWFQFLYKKFRFEAEAAMVYGSLENTRTTGQPEPNTENPAAEPSRFDDDVVGWKVQQFGLATQAEFRTLEDKLRLDFGFGWASGDPDVASLQAPRTGMERQLTADRTYSTFRFHPDYRIDLILWRNVMQRVQGAYYLRPSVQYDFSRDPNGQRLGGSAAVIWSRASEFIQAPGHKRDLGIELNFALYFQAKDGTLNDGLDKMGGFYTSLQYGVLFPLGGLGYLPQQISRYQNENGGAQLDTETAQVLRWYLGIMF